jgi:hypothetical protein
MRIPECRGLPRGDTSKFRLLCGLHEAKQNVFVLQRVCESLIEKRVLNGLVDWMLVPLRWCWKDRDANLSEEFALRVIKLIVADERGKLVIQLGLTAHGQKDLILVVGVQEETGWVQICAADLHFSRECRPVIYCTMLGVAVEIRPSVVAGYDHAVELREIRGIPVVTVLNRWPDAEVLDSLISHMGTNLMQVTVTLVGGTRIVYSHALANRSSDVKRVETVFLSGGELTTGVTCRLASFLGPVESMSGSTGNPFPVLVRI